VRYAINNKKDKPVTPDSGCKVGAIYHPGIPLVLRKRFRELCRLHHSTMVYEIAAFMRDYVKYGGFPRYRKRKKNVRLDLGYACDGAELYEAAKLMFQALAEIKSGSPFLEKHKKALDKGAEALEKLLSGS
jgi:hypothetical protein